MAEVDAMNRSAFRLRLELGLAYAAANQHT
jgi:hypothetical protein